MSATLMFNIFYVRSVFRCVTLNDRVGDWYIEDSGFGILQDHLGGLIELVV